MITYQRSSSMRWGMFALALAIGGGTGYWMWANQAEPEQPGAAAVAEKSAVGGFPSVSSNVPEPTALRAPVLADGRPSDVPADDWAALNAAMQKQGAAKGEPERMVGYLRYQRSFETWQSLDNVKDAKRRHAIAQSLLDEIPGRLSNGEFTSVEANIMATVLLADIETDDIKRNARVDEWQAKLQSIKPLSDNEQQLLAETRETELKRRQATAFAEWQAKTAPGDRTQAKLDQAMAEVRRAYNSGEF
jgi:hypothetical protein